MASGMGVRGTMGRCYGFFADYKDCLKDLRSMTKQAAMDPSSVDPEEAKEVTKKCFFTREDYFECLHGKKEAARVKRVLEEQKKQAEEAKHGVPAAH